MSHKKKNNYSNKGSNKGTSKMTASQGKKSADKPVPKVYLNLFYMSQNQTEIREISELISKAGLSAGIPMQLELWEEAGVIEIDLGQKQSIDLEQIHYEFRGEADQEYIKNHSIQSVYAIETEEQNLEQLKVLFQSVVDQFGGYVCSDSDDFMPVIITGK